jgi:hypothetical protein
MPAWTVAAWRPVLWQATRAPTIHFSHLSTRVLHAGDSAMPCSGQTLWGGSSDSGEVGVAWDWIELGEGVVAIADPLTMITNLRLIGTKGEVLTTLEAATHLNQLVNGLPWQREAQRALELELH